MNIVEKIPLSILSYIHDYGINTEKLPSSDWDLAQDLEQRMISMFHANNKKVNGKDVSFKFQNVHQMEILRNRIDVIYTTKPVVNKAKTQTWVYAMGRKVKQAKTDTSLNQIFVGIKEKADALIVPLKNECISVARQSIPQLPTNFDIKIEMDWSGNRKHSYGFYDEINPGDDGYQSCQVVMGMKTFFSRGGTPLKLKREEGSSFRSDLVIGGFETNVWQFHMMTLFCHQAAHGIQEYCHKELELGSDFSMHHGKGFEMLYSAFRSQIINHRLSKLKIKVGLK
ncbi:hypothetical protein LMH73_026790 [Vibrio splendidus]|nr:hypothetical protein [Vibrio splendidus]MCC4881480.1 hypothetical protein [Vibrio splendidus]